ncbi:60S ribosomal protein L6 [Penicillium malachiteum]|uniref:60S ribosomal protein L6 n=1 Tax=Penicillium malachiteum TaxID=1324776 RepID=A0AAD6HP79_9EURO|nr:60S ribosomal protein L6 [Penicillium malachiteum]
MSDATVGQTKQFGKGQPVVPHPAQKAQVVPVDDESQPKKVRKTIRPTKRVILLKHLDQGVLLVTGPFKINGVPSAVLTPATLSPHSKRVDVSSVDQKTLENVSAPDYFTKEKKAEKSRGGFLQAGRRPRKAVDQSILSSIKKEDFLGSYLATTFSLRNGDKPHEMKW